MPIGKKKTALIDANRKKKKPTLRKLVSNETQQLEVSIGILLKLFFLFSDWHLLKLFSFFRLASVKAVFFFPIGIC